MNIYQLQDVYHYYHDHLALYIDTLSIPSRSITGLIGPNGSGKSTLLKLLGFVQKPSLGKIYYKNIKTEPFSDPARFQITLLTQEAYLMKRSVFDNVAYGLKIRGIKSTNRKQVFQALDWVGLNPETFAGRPWNQLSGGEAQRVALAARLVLKPEVLLLDEPTAGVDVVSAQMIKLASIKAREQWGTTVIASSHDWYWLHEICDRVSYMFNGRIMKNGIENIVLGPWEKIDSRFWGRKLQDGQVLIVSKPPELLSVAVIPSDTLVLHSDRPDIPTVTACLVGVVSKMILDKTTGETMVTITVDNFSFTARKSPDEVNSLNLYPGRNVFLSYDVMSVRWHPASD